MKRILVAAGLAMAAVSLPATAALADGYEHRQPAKPKPKAKHHAKKHAKKHHAPVHRYQEHVVDYASVYPMRSHVSVSVQKHVEHSRSYYEERNGRVVAHYGSMVNPAQGCHPAAPCTWGYGQAHPPVISPEHGWWGHPGGVGYGVDGGYHGGVYVVPGGTWSTSHARSAAHASAQAHARAWSGHHGGGHVIVTPGHHPGMGHPGMGHHPGIGRPGGGHHGGCCR